MCSVDMAWSCLADPAPQRDVCPILLSVHSAVPHSPADPATMNEPSSPSIPFADIAVDAMIKLVDSDGNVVEEKVGVAMEF